MSKTVYNYYIMLSLGPVDPFGTVTFNSRVRCSYSHYLQMALVTAVLKLPKNSKDTRDVHCCKNAVCLSYFDPNTCTWHGGSLLDDFLLCLTILFQHLNGCGVEWNVKIKLLNPSGNYVSRVLAISGSAFCPKRIVSGFMWFFKGKSYYFHKQR